MKIKIPNYLNQELNSQEALALADYLLAMCGKISSKELIKQNAELVLKLDFYSCLTVKDLTIVDAMFEGNLTLKALSDKFGESERNIGYKVKSIQEKLDVENWGELIEYINSLGLSNNFYKKGRRSK